MGVAPVDLGDEWWISWWIFWVVTGDYPLVNVYMTNWKSTMFNGQINYFYGNFPGNDCYITMENHHLQWIFPWIAWWFSSSLCKRLPEGNGIYPPVVKRRLSSMGKSSKYSLGISHKWAFPLHPDGSTSCGHTPTMEPVVGSRQAVKSSLQDSISQLRNLGPQVWLQSMFKWFNHHVKSQSVVLVSLQGEASQI